MKINFVGAPFCEQRKSLVTNPFELLAVLKACSKACGSFITYLVTVEAKLLKLLAMLKAFSKLCRSSTAYVVGMKRKHFELRALLKA